MKKYRQKAKSLQAMAHPVRLQLPEALEIGPACDCELVVKTGRRRRASHNTFVVAANWPR